MTYDWGYTVGPYAVGASWSLSNPVGTLDPSSGHTTLMTGTTPGTAMFEGFIAVYQDYGWDGLNCYEYGTYEGGGEQPVEVVPIRYTRVTQQFGTAEFPVNPVGTVRATLSLPNDSPPCTGTAFQMHVRFDKSNGATLYGDFHPGNKVSTDEDSQYRVNGWGLEDETSSSPYFNVRLQRIQPTNENKPIEFIVSGVTSSGEFNARARVVITCE